MLRLPHPELSGVLDGIKRNVVGMRGGAVAGLDVWYAVFRHDPEIFDIGACYDAEGAIYVPESIVALDQRFADLIAYHEHLEIRHKLAARSHAYAHRQAYVAELLAARQVFGTSAEFWRYLRWRIGGYPEWKVPDPESVVAQLEHVLTEDRPRKGDLLRVIKENRL